MPYECNKSSKIIIMTTKISACSGFISISDFDSSKYLTRPPCEEGIEILSCAMNKENKAKFINFGLEKSRGPVSHLLLVFTRVKRPPTIQLSPVTGCTSQEFRRFTVSKNAVCGKTPVTKRCTTSFHVFGHSFLRQSHPFLNPL